VRLIETQLTILTEIVHLFGSCTTAIHCQNKIWAELYWVILTGWVPCWAKSKVIWKWIKQEVIAYMQDTLSPMQH